MPRGFDDLHTPAGLAMVAACLLMFVVLCSLGASWMRIMMGRDREARERLREAAEASPLNDGTRIS